ncbi:type II secretion system F family protein [Candidatus Woesearchaeota archaeon]|nr:type II secretion system F family protein [Candidatus Woesearchaeota archaeon]
MYEFVQRLYPVKLKNGYQQLLIYCNIVMDVNRFLTVCTFVSVIATIVLTLFTLIFFDVNFLILLVAWFALIQGIIYTWLVLTADSRARFVEELLPDALQLMSSNLRAGLTVDRALLLSARPEFGHFKDELNYVGKQLATGKELGAALMELSARIRSDKLKKTFQIIVSAMASGGELAELLVQTASNLRQQRLIEQRVRSSVLVYVIFIFSAIAFGAPMLFGLSSFLVEVISDIFSKVQLPPQETTNLPLSFTKVSVPPSFINTYTIVSMIFTSIMGSLILGLIAKGKEKEGLKYLPILIIVTLSLYFLVKFSIKMLLGGLFQF